ncbi:unnamed protein product [Boreogadus saida]
MHSAEPRRRSGASGQTLAPRSQESGEHWGRERLSGGWGRAREDERGPPALPLSVRDTFWLKNLWHYGFWPLFILYIPPMPTGLPGSLGPTRTLGLGEILLNPSLASQGQAV